MSTFDKQAGARLRTVRYRLGLTTYAISEALKIPQSTYSKYENGSMSIKVETLAALYLKYDALPLYICTGKGPVFNGKEKHTISTDIAQLKAESEAMKAKIDYLASRPK